MAIFWHSNGNFLEGQIGTGLPDWTQVGPDRCQMRHIGSLKTQDLSQSSPTFGQSDNSGLGRTGARMSAKRAKLD